MIKIKYDDEKNTNVVDFEDHRLLSKQTRKIQQSDQCLVLAKKVWQS